MGLAHGWAIVNTKVIGLLGGVVFGFTLAWARLTDPRVIRDMLLLKEPHVFLIMASAVAIAAVGVRVLKTVGARCIVTGEPVDWSVEQPRTRHVAGSILFGLGWTVAGTCPGPVAAMIGEGRLVGVPVVVGLLAGVTLQRMLAARKNVEAHIPAPAAAGL
jgi:uncharacterized membrane protein YedE/YeeE